MPRVLYSAVLLVWSQIGWAESFALQSFKQLSALQGTWQGSYQNGSSHQVEYKLMSRGSILVETWTMSPTSQSMTVYHLDGDRLFATHYCPQGNQPRLALDKAKSKDGLLQFNFVDGNNLNNPKKSHQYQFQIRLKPDGSFSRSENYRNNSDFNQVDIGEMVTYQSL